MSDCSISIDGEFWYEAVGAQRNVHEDLTHALKSTRGRAFDRPHRAPKGIGRLGFGKILEVAKHKGGPLAWRESGHRVHQFHLRFHQAHLAGGPDVKPILECPTKIGRAS